MSIGLNNAGWLQKASQYLNQCWQRLPNSVNRCYASVRHVLLFIICGFNIKWQFWKHIVTEAKYCKEGSAIHTCALNWSVTQFDIHLITKSHLSKLIKFLGKCNPFRFRHYRYIIVILFLNPFTKLGRLIRDNHMEMTQFFVSVNRWYASRYHTWINRYWWKYLQTHIHLFQSKPCRYWIVLRSMMTCYCSLLLVLEDMTVEIFHR